MNQGGAFFQVDIHDNLIAGHIGLGCHEFFLQDLDYTGIDLGRLYIKPDLIGKGLGSKLLTLGETWVRSKKFTEYYPYVHENNRLGISFYLRKGFERVHELDSPQDHELCMKKKLS
ncbi:MAG: GNAT family N-acetyltransferase [Candidatus Heimdallarchaeota archaeon]|nr:GNAT family N-acetyltransferase [Candidatus Heimdallarchaeota archaeon]